MKYNKTTDYALHIMYYFVHQDGNKNISLQDIVRQFQDVSPTYLSKILTQLTKAGLIRSTPGKNGGYQLIRDPKKVSFLDVIVAINGKQLSEPMPVCRSQECAIQDVIQVSEKKALEYLAHTKLWEIGDDS